MKKKIILSSAVALLISVGLWLFTPPAHFGSRLTPTLVPTGKSTADYLPSGPKSPNVEQKGSEAIASLSSAPGPSSVDSTAIVDRTQSAQIRAALQELKNVYGQAGSLPWDEAKALIAQREKKTKEMVDRLAQLGPGGAQALAATYPEADNTRARLLLVHALGKINDPEAASALQELLVGDNSFSLRKEMVLALGQRSEPAGESVLVALLAGNDDPQLRFAAAQALSGRANALPAMAERLQTESAPDVRRELVRSVGLVGSDAAITTLAQLAQTSGDTATRQTAIQELGRTFGARALAPLEHLLSDSDETIRATAIKVVARITARR